MSFRSFYENTGVDYNAFLKRMNGREALIEKYIRIFMADTTYAELEQKMAEGDYEAVGMKAHTLKGIALNLNLEKLSSLCADMTDSVRSGNIQNLDDQFEQVKVEYAFIIENLGS